MNCFWPLPGHGDCSHQSGGGEWSWSTQKTPVDLLSGTRQRTCSTNWTVVMRVFSVGAVEASCCLPLCIPFPPPLPPLPSPPLSFYFFYLGRFYIVILLVCSSLDLKNSISASSNIPHLLHLPHPWVFLRHCQNSLYSELLSAAPAICTCSPVTGYYC